MIAESTPQRYDLAGLTFANASPVWDGEAGGNSRGVSADEIWRDWYQPYFDYVIANGDVIRAVAYINANWNRQPKWAPPYHEGYWGDARLEINPVIAERWRRQISDRSIWLHGGPNLRQQLE